MQNDPGSYLPGMFPFYQKWMSVHLDHYSSSVVWELKTWESVLKAWLEWKIFVRGLFVV